MPRARTACAAALLVLVTGCAADPGTAPREGGGSTSGTSEDPTPSQPATSTAEPASAPLDWQRAGDAAVDRTLVGPEWTLRTAHEGGDVTLTRDGDEVVVPAGQRRLVSGSWMDEEWAVVVAQDETGRSDPPVVATAVDLATGTTHPVDDPAPAPGAWALHDGEVLYPAYDGDRYCLATADLTTGAGAPHGELTGYCAEPRHGFSRVHANEHGIALMTFDDRRPASCRTLGSLDGGTFAELADVPDCTGWDVALTATGAIWSTVEDEHRQDEGHFFARHDDQLVDLGPGTTGTLTTCGDSAYFTADPRRRGQAARLMRWTPAGSLEVAYETHGQGMAFLAPPVCAGGVLTLSAFAEGGDELVYAEVP